jgi:hypothetical protein
MGKPEKERNNSKRQALMNKYGISIEMYRVDRSDGKKSQLIDSDNLTPECYIKFSERQHYQRS